MPVVGRTMILPKLITRLSKCVGPIAWRSSEGPIVWKLKEGAIAPRSGEGAFGWGSSVGPTARMSTRAPTLRVCAGSVSLEQRRYNSTAALTPFMGTWVQDSHKGYEKVLKAFGVSPQVVDSLLKRKTVYKYDRDGDTLLVSQGAEDSDEFLTYKVILGEYFVSTFYDGRPLNSVIFEYEGCLTEQHETVYMPTLFMKLVREVEPSGNRMICTKKVGKLFMEKTYKKK